MSPSEGEETGHGGDSGDERACDADLETLREVFLAGFTMGRTGKYYGEIPPISKRAAETGFQQYARHTLESSIHD